MRKREKRIAIIGPKRLTRTRLGGFCSVRDYQRRFTTPSGKLVFHIMGAPAELERRRFLNDQSRDIGCQKTGKYLSQSVSN
ncbi:hypothetical protein SAMN05216428_102264 [Nitrosospira sp. Nsp11]|nr:hypothetical protein SAMN05216428_102264 [Nitrosospira sp. Nsp11]